MAGELPTRIGIVVIGDEILSARRQDKHLAQVIGTLKTRGLTLDWAQYLSDEKALLVRQFREVRSSGEICFSFGGIGATPDDRTRQAMAQAHDVPLQRHPGAVREIEARFGKGAYPLRVLMAELPEGASLIPNPYNQVPGFSVGHIHCLPGFPEMAWPMMEWVLDEYYMELYREPDVQCLLTAHDVVESELIPLMNSLQEKYPAVKLSSLPHFFTDGKRQIEFGVSGQAEGAMAMFAELKNALSEKGYAFDELKQG